MASLEAYERVDMSHVQGTTWRFRYELFEQSNPALAPTPVDLTGRTYECQWLAEKGSDEVVATATIEMAGAAQGYVSAVVPAGATQPVGDHWFYLREINGSDDTVLFAGTVVVEDVT